MTDFILCWSEKGIRVVEMKLNKIDKEITLKRFLEKPPLVADVEKSVG